MPVLDASFLIDLEQGLPAARQALAAIAGDRLVVPGHAALEAMVGAADPAKALADLKNSYQVILADEALMVAAARLRASVRGKARPQWGDVYIAATARASQDYVVTANPRDFEALGCRAWDFRRGGTRPQ